MGLTMRQKIRKKKHRESKYIWSTAIILITDSWPAFIIQRHDPSKLFMCGMAACNSESTHTQNQPHKINHTTICTFIYSLLAKRINSRTEGSERHMAPKASNSALLLRLKATHYETNGLHSLRNQNGAFPAIRLQSAACSLWLTRERLWWRNRSRELQRQRRVFSRVQTH